MGPRLRRSACLHSGVLHSQAHAPAERRRMHPARPLNGAGRLTGSAEKNHLKTLVYCDQVDMARIMQSALLDRQNGRFASAADPARADDRTRYAVQSRRPYRSQGVTHRYRRASETALSDVTFEIQPCEALASSGGRAAASPRLLHIMAGLIQPTAGEVRIDGLLVAQPSPRWIVMFQQPHLYPWMTVAQNVGLGLRFAGRRREANPRARGRASDAGRD